MEDIAQAPLWLCELGKQIILYSNYYFSTISEVFFAESKLPGVGMCVHYFFSQVEK